MEVEVFADGMDGHHDAGDALGQAHRGALKLGQTAVGDTAEFLDEPAKLSTANPRARARCSSGSWPNHAQRNRRTAA